MTERKDRLAVVARLLTAIKIHPDSAFTRQHQAANLNHAEAHNLIDGLLANGYVEAFVIRSRTQYKITPKGREFLSKIVDCYMLLDEVELCVDRFVKEELQKELEEIIS